LYDIAANKMKTMMITMRFNVTHGGECQSAFWLNVAKQTFAATKFPRPNRLRKFAEKKPRLSVCLGIVAGLTVIAGWLIFEQLLFTIKCLSKTSSERHNKENRSNSSICSVATDIHND